MSRGGYRAKAGRKTTWISGCKFEDTKIIRIPKMISNKVLEIAHKLDAGDIIDLDTKINILEEENFRLKQELEKLEANVESSKIETVNNQQLELELSTHISKIESLIEKAKEIIYDEKIFRLKDRYIARKAIATLLNVDKNLLT